MSPAKRDRKAWALGAMAVLLAVGLAGYFVEERALAEDASPDGVGFGVPWSHELHARHPDFTCQTCHHDSKAGQSRMKACDSCHPRRPMEGAHRPGREEDTKAPEVRLALHKSCVGCHQAVEQGPEECADCHSGVTGTEACGHCHQDTLATLREGPHKLVGCASCHTDLEDNLVDGAHPAPVPAARSKQSCLACHGAPDGDPSGFPQKRLTPAQLPPLDAVEGAERARLAHNPERGGRRIRLSPRGPEPTGRPRPIRIGGPRR